MKPQHLTPVIALSCALAHADAPPSASGDITNLPLSGFVEATSLEQLADLVVTDTKLGQTPDSVTQRIVVLKSDEIARLPTPNGNLAELMRHTSGQFVNVLSRNDANWGAYAVSKFATEGLMQVLAAELADTSIRVNAINPGATRTRMRAQACPDEDPTQRPTPTELMPLYLDLMGPAGDAIHGQSLDAQAVAKR